MYRFDLVAYVRDHLRSLLHGLGPAALPRPLRALAVIVHFWVFLGLQFWHRVAFLIDDVLYPDWRDQPLGTPLFIVGPPRSGTTWLHRLLAEDRETFTTMSMGEILLAPAICQKRLLAMVAGFDRLLGSPLARTYRFLHARFPRPLADVHDLDLLAPEEDELLFLHLWESHLQFLIVPSHPSHEALGRFDEALGERRRRRLMHFYQDMVRRHLYALGSGRSYLAKAPSFAAKVRSLSETFDACRVVMPLRTPDEVAPSVLSLARHLGQATANRELTHPEDLEPVLAMLEHLYLHPAEVGPRALGDRFRLVRYRDMQSSLESELEAVYRVLGAPVPSGFAPHLATEAEAARRYRSRHRYSLEEFGLDPERLRTRLARVYQRFGFEACAGSAPDPTPSPAGP